MAIRTMSERTRPAPPVWPAALIALGLLLYMLAPRENLLPSAIIALVVYGSAMYVFPACRPRRDRAISPATWAIGLFGLSMVVCPMLVAFFGPVRSVLPFQPTSTAMDRALMTTSVAFVAFCASFALTYGRVDPASEACVEPAGSAPRSRGGSRSSSCAWGSRASSCPSEAPETCSPIWHRRTRPALPRPRRRRSEGWSDSSFDRSSVSA